MYERHGFRHIPQRLGDSGHTATTIFMVKDLHPIKIVQYQPKYKHEGNTRLEASIALYRKLGFHEIPLQGNAYERCDILMLFDLDL